MKNKLLSGILALTLCAQSVFAIERVNISSGGEQTKNGRSSSSSISFDGQFAVFWSTASNLVKGDTNGVEDIFIHNHQTGQTERVNVSFSGEQANGYSSSASISGDGRFVVFDSTADNLVNGDVNDQQDVFVKNLETGEIELVSISSTGEQVEGWWASAHSISADGRFVVFSSYAENLVDGDTNNVSDIFIHDRHTEITERINVSSTGEQANDNSSSALASADGQIIIFSSEATNLVNGDTNNASDIFIHNRRTGITNRANVSSSGEQATANSHSFTPVISADGRFVVFSSYAENLVDGDTNNASDIFIHNRETGITERVSVSSNGIQADAHSFDLSVSRNGRFVTFSSWASNLVKGDTNDVDTNFDSIADIFVKDRTSGRIVRVNLSASGEQTDAYSGSPLINAGGDFVLFTSEASNLVENDTNYASDVFITKNPLINNLQGRPSIDQAAESGVYIWQDQSGRTYVKMVAGGTNEKGKYTHYRGSLIAEELISSITPISLEIGVPNKPDIMTQMKMNQLDFEMYTMRPYKDSFSFVADTSKSLCIILDDYADGLFLGPNKVKVTPPYDINLHTACDSQTIPVIGGPEVISNTEDHGIFLWKNNYDKWISKVVAGNGFSIVDININSEQTLSGFASIKLETNDGVEVLPNIINLNLRIAPPWQDGFKFMMQSKADTCVSTTSSMPIYIGPKRVSFDGNVNLNTLKNCQ